MGVNSVLKDQVMILQFNTWSADMVFNVNILIF